MKLVFFLILLLCTVVNAQVRIAVKFYGANSMRLIFAPRTNTQVRYMHTFTAGNSIVVVPIIDGKSRTAVCRQSQSTAIIVEPQGCDSPVPGQSIENSNCALGGVLAEAQAAATLRELWQYRRDSVLCTDPDSCLGPVWIGRQGWVPADGITDYDLLTGSVFLVSGAGPVCGIPVVTPINVQLPQLNVSVNQCPDSMVWDFHGIYEPYYHDAVVNYSYVFRRQFAQTQQRVLMFQEPDGYRVLLASDLVVKFTSLDVYENPIDTLSTMINFTDNCSAFFTLIPSPPKLELIGPETVDDLNYLYNDQDLYRSAFCSFGVGQLTIDLNYKFPRVPEGVVFGGFPVFRNPGLTGYRFKILPQYEYRDFDPSCAKWYPLNNTFRGFGFSGNDGPEYNRDSPAEYSCFTPFIVPELILSSTSQIIEKAKQCQMQGCVPGLSTQDVCRCEVWQTYCRKQFFYFDQRCYYKFDVYRDTKYRVPQAQADTVCKQIHPAAVAVTQTTQYSLAWLQKRFVFFNRQQPGFPTRLFLQGRRCQCYDYNDNGTVISVVTECNCDLPNFPLCAYHIKDDKINLPNADPNTLTILRDGQDGMPYNGKQITCTCVAGSAGQFCNLRTCYPPLSASFNSSNPFERFFAQCYLQQSGNEQSNGNCNDLDPNRCLCNFGFGPPSVYGDNYTSIVCAVPSASRSLSNQGFQVNGITYFDDRYGVCNTRMAGIGFVNAATGYGYCTCNDRTNMDPDALVRREKAWDGRACTGRVPMLMPDGYEVNEGIRARFCNGRGTVCPSGERLGEQRLDGSYVVVLNRDKCFDYNGVPIDGCVCDDGWDGVACTSPVPNNILVDVETQLKDQQTYFSLDLRTYISHVTVLPSNSCIVTNVSVSETTFSFPPCTYNATAKQYDCKIWGSFVSVFASNPNPLCIVKAFSVDFPPCGLYTNPTAARFFANEEYRAYLFYTEPQPYRYAIYGSTNTACFCDPNHTGALCGVGISAYRTDADGQVTARVCGETTSPPRGALNEDQSKCICNKIGNFIFREDACECAWFEGYNGTLQECGGHGICRRVSFPYGRCEFDNIDFQNDALISPFSNVVPIAMELPRYAFYDVNGLDSIVVINNTSWFLAFGQVLTVPSLIEDVNYCYNGHMFPLNFTYNCDGQFAPPRRAIANVTIRRNVCGEYECNLRDHTELCDPAFSCSTGRFCDEFDLQYPCILKPLTRWAIDSTNGATLNSGTYINSWIMCANATQINRQPESAPYGVFDCANPGLRPIDWWLFIAKRVNQTQCGSEPITAYSNVLGQFFGILDKLLPGLRFDGKWILENYAMIASLLNNQVCVFPDGTPDGDALDDAIIDQYGISIVSVDPEVVVSFTNDTSTPLTPLEIVNSTEFFFNGLFGNPLYHEVNIQSFPNISYDGFTFHRRPGISAIIPQLSTNQEFRQISIRIRFPIYGLQIYGPSGQVCASIMRLVLPGEIVTVDCIEAFAAEPYYVSMLRFLNQSTNATVLAQAFETFKQNNVIWYWPLNRTEDSFFYASDFAITSRNSSYAGLWDSFLSSVLVQHRFPYNAPFEQSCLARGNTLRPVNLTTDQKFLMGVYTSYLSPRRCSETRQCKKFARNQQKFTCVLDEAPKRSWLNGPKVDEIVGDEGGCDVAYNPGIRDSQTSGETCVAGYTPNDANLTWFAIQDFQQYVLAKFPSFVSDYDAYPVYNVSEISNVACTLPISDDSTRPIEVCGGARGVLRRSEEMVMQNVTVMSEFFIRRCPQMIVNNLVLDIRPLYYSVSIASWVSPMNATLTIIKDRTFFNREEQFLSAPCTSSTCTYTSGLTVECVPLISSETQRIRSSIAGEIKILVEENFFNYRVF